MCYEIEEAYIVTLSGNPERRNFRNTLRHELTHYLSGVPQEQTFLESWGITMEEACRERVAWCESGVL